MNRTREHVMQTSSKKSPHRPIYFAQSFHRGEPALRSLVLAIGSQGYVEAAARGYRDLHPEDGVAVYRALMDEPTPVSYRLVDYFSSELGEAWHPGFAPHYQHGLLE